ncbi:MAG: cobalamin B12-binding domain-containing protein [Thermoleophilia bacterium]
MITQPESMLVASVERLEEDRVTFLVNRALVAGQPPMSVLQEAREGLERVSAQYAAGQYFLADLLMGAHIFRGVLDRLMEVAPALPDPSVPPIVFGTVQGDIHEIGKNLTIAFMRYGGLQIVDLGGNVPPERFVEAVLETGAPVVCMSALMTSCYGPMRRTIQALGKAGVRTSTTVVIGGHVSESVKRHVGADFWTRDCLSGVDMCRKLVLESAGRSARSASGAS